MMPADVWVVVGLGGNVGDDATLRARFAEAIRSVASHLQAVDVRVSGLFRTAPVGPVVDQPAFLNAVAAFRTASPRPSGLMRELLRLERAAGRERDASLAKGPRTLDLDVLLVGDMTVTEQGPPAVCVPHPELHRRRFVLEPLSEVLAEGGRIPGCSLSIRELLATGAIASQTIERVASSTWFDVSGL